jgi:hypothetical protein
MFEIETRGADTLAKKLDQWSEQIKGLQTKMPEQLHEWQTEDMRRHYPNMDVTVKDNVVEASTSIWPRSRLSEEDEKRRRANMVHTTGPKRFRPVGGGPRAATASTRPILRDALFDELDQRMVAMLDEAGKCP